MKQLNAVVLCTIVFMVGALAGVMFANSKMNHRLIRINEAVSKYVVQQQTLVAVYEPAITSLTIELKDFKEAEESATK